MSLTDEQLAEIRQRAEEATPSPWTADIRQRGDCVVWGPDGRFVGNMGTAPHWVVSESGAKRPAAFDVDRRDAVFIANARQDVPALLADRDELAAQVAAVRAELAEKTEEWKVTGQFMADWVKRLKAELAATVPAPASEQAVTPCLLCEGRGWYPNPYPNTTTRIGCVACHGDGELAAVPAAPVPAPADGACRLPGAHAFTAPADWPEVCQVCGLEADEDPHQAIEQAQR